MEKLWIGMHEWFYCKHCYGGSSCRRSGEGKIKIYSESELATEKTTEKKPAHSSKPIYQKEEADDTKHHAVKYKRQETEYIAVEEESRENWF